MNTITAAFRRTWRAIMAHKVISVIILIVVLGGGYLLYKRSAASTTQTRYVLGTVQRGNVTVAVSGSGQVSASNQVDIKPKVSGDVLSVNVTAGQQVKKGDIIATLDAGDASKTYRNALLDLQNAKIAYDKVVQPADSLTLTQAENAEEAANRAVADSYTKAYTEIASTFIVMPNQIDTLKQDLIEVPPDSYLDSDRIRNIWGEAGVTEFNSISSRFADVLAAYNDTQKQYSLISRTSATSSIAALLDTTYTLNTNLIEVTKDLKALIDKLAALQPTNSSTLSAITSDQNTIGGFITSEANNESNLLAAKNGITDSIQSLNEKIESLQKVQQGADNLDVQSAQLSVAQRENALADAAETLGDYTVRSPIDGVVAKVDVEKGQSGSSGTAVATVVTKDQVADISLNELDAAKVKVGDKATLTFDALPDLTLTGEVVELNLVGTVTQGVVSYDMKIGFDTQDDRVKPGMSVTSNIITDSKQDVLVVPNSAIKTAAEGSATVQVVEGQTATGGAQGGVALTGTPQTVQVVKGISSDTNTEIVSGLNEGDTVIVRTISGTATTQTTGGAGILGGGNNRFGGGGGGARPAGGTNRGG